MVRVLVLLLGVLRGCCCQMPRGSPSLWDIGAVIDTYVADY
jgi:hypothetical protein